MPVPFGRLHTSINLWTFEQSALDNVAVGRREKSLDPQNGPLHAFVSDLRTLRIRAGSPSYRELAAQTHFAPSTLSAAAAGRRLPSLDVTLAYVSACGGDRDEWQQRWHGLADDPAPVAGAQLQQRDRRPIWIAVIATAAALAGGAIAVAAGWAGGSTPGGSGIPSSAPATTALRPSGLAAAHDGADPILSGCSTPANSLATVELAGSDGRVYGIVELRYSAVCHAGWTRYTPSAGSPDPTTVTITIDRSSPTGNASVTFVVHRGAIYSDMELFQNGCLRAAATVADGGQPRASARTDCVREPT